MLDLMNIARTEADDGDLMGVLGKLYQDTDVRPQGYPKATIWQGGNHDGKVHPVAHSLTDAYALLGTVAAIDILGLPFYAVLPHRRLCPARHRSRHRHSRPAFLRSAHVGADPP